MTFSDHTPQLPLDISAEEMLKISSDINLRFAPDVGSLLAEAPGIFVGASIQKPTLSPPGRADRDLLHSSHDARIGLTPQELLDISRDVGNWFQRGSALSALDSELMLLPVDPSHLYAYWHLGEDIGPVGQSRASQDDLTLRVYWRPDGNSGQTSSNVWFDVNIDTVTDRRKVPVPIDDSAYSATLGKVGHDNRFQALAHSNLIRIPSGTSKSTSAPGPETANCRDRNDAEGDMAGNGGKRGRPESLRDPYTNSAVTDILVQSQQTVHRLAEAGWRVRLHFRHSPDADGSVSLPDAELFRWLDDQGVDVQLIPESACSETSQVRTDRASGQGI